MKTKTKKIQKTQKITWITTIAEAIKYSKTARVLWKKLKSQLKKTF